MPKRIGPIVVLCLTLTLSACFVAHAQDQGAAGQTTTVVKSCPVATRAFGSVVEI